MKSNANNNNFLGTKVEGTSMEDFVLARLREQHKEALEYADHYLIKAQGLAIEIRKYENRKKLTK